jgi:hypothetical protein
MIKKEFGSDREVSLVGTLTSPKPDYPWYELAKGIDLEQGDILPDIPILEIDNILEFTGEEEIGLNYFDMILMNQSCDLVVREGKCKIEYATLCPIYFKDKLNHPYFNEKSKLNEIREGKHLGYHLLNSSNIEEKPFDLIIVDLKRTHSIKIDSLREIAVKQESRIRLRSPYRERLAKAFGDFFARIGTPSDIPKIK